MTKITELNIRKLKPGTRVTDRGLVARCLPSGEVTFGYQYGSRQARRWINIGVHGHITVAIAYEPNRQIRLARSFTERIRRNLSL